MTEPVIVDLHDAEHTERFRVAPIFQKNAVVTARQVKTPEFLDTVLANGFLETSREVPVGHWIITNPGGEEYAKTEEQFKERYEFLGLRDGKLTFRAKGIIRAYSNPTGQSVEIMTPWDAKQYGDAQCYFGVTVDENYEPTDFRYIIGKEEFDETYEWAEATNLLVQLLQVTGEKNPES
jgi:hypothetical protein